MRLPCKCQVSFFLSFKVILCSAKKILWTFYSTPFGGRVYKWCPSVRRSLCLSSLLINITDISVSVAQIKKIKNTRCIFFEFCFWEDPPHPVNWSPTHSTGPQAPFFTDIWVSVAQIKKLKKTRCFFSSSYFASGRTLPTQSTGPKPNSTGPQALFFTDICH